MVLHVVHKRENATIGLVIVNVVQSRWEWYNSARENSLYFVPEEMGETHEVSK